MTVRPPFEDPVASISARQRHLSIAVVGSGISGLSAAWLLSKRHRVTVFEAETRLGGHSNTVDAGGIAVDTGFIVYNDFTYPNLTALFAHLNVPTKLSDMSFGVSLDDGRLEYAGTGLPGLFAQPANLTSRRFWHMLRDLARFYREAPRDAAQLGQQPLGAYLAEKGYSAAFRDDHLYPMAAAIWSTPAADIGAYPAAAFIRFCQNHGLLQFLNRPLWRTVDGGSRAYVERILADFRGEVAKGQPVVRLRRRAEGADVLTGDGRTRHFDAVVVATHADQALRLLADPSDEERHVLGAFNYISNRAVLHADVTLMPKRRLVWAAWNYLSHQGEHGRDLSVTYWMNKLQGIPRNRPMFVTLNPIREPAAGLVYRTETYEHPQFDAAAMAAQAHLWSLQGLRHTWYCGAHFGAGFHEDGLQSGLAVAEELGGVRRPWTVAAESGRIILDRIPIPGFAAEAAQ